MSSSDNTPGCFSIFRRRARTERTRTGNLHSVAGPAQTEVHHPEHDHYACTGLCDFSDPSYMADGKAWDEPPAYEVGGYAFDEEATKTIEETIDGLDGELRELSMKIHDHPELMFKEVYAHKVLTDFMEAKGFEVTRHYLGLDTAWMATISVGKGGRILGFNSEMDALPGIGHACGHNLIAIGGVAAAVGVATALKKHNIAGTVSLIGTPAEEGGAGKAILLERGAYNDFAACLMIHPSPGGPKSTGVATSLAIERLDAEFAGQTAHAAAAPWEGRNALDAAMVSYAAISALRQQIKPTHRVHGVVEGRDWAANIIPDYAKLTYLIRAPSYQEVKELEPRIKACFEAGAHATNTKLTYGTATFMYDLFQNGALEEEYRRVCEGRYGMVLNMTEVRASTDFGNISYALPGLHPHYGIPAQPGGGNHTRAFAAAAATPEAHQATLWAAKGIAVTGLRVVIDAKFAAQVKEDFKAGKPE